MTSIVTLVLVLSLTSSGIFSLPSGTRNRSAGEDDENDVAKGATDFIEAANAMLGRLRSGPHIAYGDIAHNVATRSLNPCPATGCTWPKDSQGFVYVPIQISTRYSSAEQKVIIQSLVEFHSVSCIRFIWRQNHKDYLELYPSTGCWSNVGLTGGRQRISIQQPACVNTGVIHHEILHALGFDHEHSRSDRDDHVQIITKNIQPDYLWNFVKRNSNNLGTPYDYNSIMHYGRYSYSKNNGVLETIVPIPDSTVVIGKATKMSGNDIKRLNQLYQCSDN